MSPFGSFEADRLLKSVNVITIGEPDSANRRVGCFVSGGTNMRSCNLLAIILAMFAANPAEALTPWGVDIETYANATANRNIYNYNRHDLLDGASTLDRKGASYEFPIIVHDYKTNQDVLVGFLTESPTALSAAIRKTETLHASADSTGAYAADTMGAPVGEAARAYAQHQDTVFLSGDSSISFFKFPRNSDGLYGALDIPASQAYFDVKLVLYARSRYGGYGDFFHAASLASDLPPSLTLWTRVASPQRILTLQLINWT